MSRNKTSLMLAISLAASLLAAPLTGHAESSESVVASNVQVSVEGRTFAVQEVTIDLTDPTLELAPVVSDGGIGHVEPFSSMVDREQAVAAVNGTFFNAYEADPYSRFPNGALLQDGQLIHSGDNQTLVLTKDKTADIQQVKLGLTIQVGTGMKATIIEPWGVNKVYGDSDTSKIVWYTPAFGGWVGFVNGMMVVVRDGRIDQISQDAVPVPDDGYVLFIGASSDNRKYIWPKLHVGDPVATTLTATGADGSKQDARSWLAAIGVGPKLVTDGAIDLDAARDGFTDPKIVSESAARSFVGVDGSGRLVMGTVPYATMAQLAAIAQQLGLQQAMNMDGGSSSALYANDTMLTSPGRELSNALVVRKLARPKVQIAINGSFVPDFQGFIVNDTTLVPIRPFITALGAGFQWDNATRTAIISSGGVTLRLQDGSHNAIVSGKSVPLDVPLQILPDSRMYVPLRFVAETLHAKVDWNQSLYRASVKLP